jgi:hypothetical protein
MSLITGYFVALRLLQIMATEDIIPAPGFLALLEMKEAAAATV